MENTPTHREKNMKMGKTKGNCERKRENKKMGSKKGKIYVK
jgi:hypothetical protein